MSRALGSTMEETAKRHLEKKGLQTVAQNFHCKLGEIDLIMRDADTLVFIEVRYRKKHSFGSPAATVTASKQRKLARAAQLFLQRHRHWRDHTCRFDVVGLSGEKDNCAIEWIQRAFTTQAEW